MVQQLEQQQQQLEREHESVLNLMGWAWSTGERVPSELVGEVGELARQVLEDGGGDVQQVESLAVLQTRAERWKLIKEMLLGK